MTEAFYPQYRSAFEKRRHYLIILKQFLGYKGRLDVADLNKREALSKALFGLCYQDMVCDCLILLIV